MNCQVCERPIKRKATGVAALFCDSVCMKIAEAMAVGALKDAYLHDRKIKRRLGQIIDAVRHDLKLVAR